MAVSRKGRWPPGRTTLRDVAAELGVSAKTVSNAYNQPDQLSPQLRKRVLETARRLGYGGPDPLARNLRRGWAGAIGVIYANRLSYAVDDTAAAAFLSGVCSVAEQQGAGLVLVPGSAPQQRNAAAIGHVAIDGVVAYSLADDDPLLLAVVDRRLPVVVVDQPQLSEVPWVGIDDESAAAAAARHLCDLGHRRLGVVSFALTRHTRRGPADARRQTKATYQVTRRRLTGYERALTRCGLQWADVTVVEGQDSTVAEGAAAAEWLLTRQPRPTALLCLSDRLAQGALQTAAKHGLGVPRDLSVVGFDDASPPGPGQITPPLTSVHQPHRDKGLLAAEILFAEMRGGDVHNPSPLPAELVVRATTGPPPPDA